MLQINDLIHTVTLVKARNDKFINTGTAFFVKKDDQHYLFSNRHIFETCHTFSFSIPFMGDNNQYQIENTEIEISPTCHPEYDLAAIGINDVVSKMAEKGERKYSIKFIEYNDILSEDKIHLLSDIEHVYLIGYPHGLKGDSLGIPIVKHGITSTSILHNYKRKEEFITDIYCDKGSSGSPIFIEKNDQFFLLGIHYSKLELDTTNISLGVNIKSSVLYNWLES